MFAKSPTIILLLAVLAWTEPALAVPQVPAWLTSRSTSPVSSSLTAPLGNTPHPAVARVTVTEKNNTQSLGSGTLIDVRDNFGLVITNWHVVRDAAGDILVTFPSGFTSPARILKTDKDWDLAALVIWKPDVQPVAISAVPPRPGDTLTIAGYGSGSYRATSGRCTQYVSPGAKFPYEMVELSAQARQGDSGGPIFNEQGEMAGVLFGASRGSTSGSYGGRVRMFLASVVPNFGQGGTTLVAQQNSTPPAANTETKFAQQVGNETWTDSSRSPSAANSTLPEARGNEVATALVPVPNLERALPQATVRESPTDFVSFSGDSIQHTPLPDRSPTATSRPTEFDWQRWLGKSPFEQAKSVFAAIGLLAVFLRLTRRNSVVQKL